MKNFKYYLLIVLMGVGLQLVAQSDSETIKKSFKLTDTTQETWFCVCNIEGDVEVEAYDGNTIEVEVFKKISARRADDVAEGMKDINVEFTQGEGFVRAILSSPQNEYREKDDPLACGWNWRGNNDRVYYRHRLDFKVKVPRGISVKISTVNNGDLFIKGSQGEIYANNVNGDVELVDIAHNTKAHTVNGTIEVTYTKVPEEFADFETINGNIEVSAPKDAGAVYNFETQYGEVYSDLDFSKRLSPKMEKNQGKRGGTLYKMSNTNSYQVGEGGPLISFKTMNGDIRVRKGK